MVIEKILKVNSNDPKVDELRKRLAALQEKSGPTQQTGQGTPGTPGSNAQKPITPSQPVPTGSSKDDIARLQQLSIEEQRRLVERNNPDVRLREERTLNLVMNQITEIITINNETTKKLKDIEAKQVQLEKGLENFKDKHEDLLQKMNSIDSRLEKFMGLYELITNQYNPFASEPGPKIPRLAPVQSVPRVATTPIPVTAPNQPQRITIEDNLAKTNAEVIVNPEDHVAAQSQFKRVEELLADLQEKETDKQTVPPASTSSKPLPQNFTIPPEALAQELHKALGAFEDRMKQQFDRTIQDKLHEQFGKLETSIQAEVRDALKAEIEAVQKDDDEVQRALAELQQLMQSREGAGRDTVENELASLTQGMSRVRDEVRTLPPNLYFRVADAQGTILKDLADLREAIRAMSPETFAHHVTPGRNDFAAWVEHALLMPNLALLMRENPTPEGMLQAIIAHDGLND